MGCWAVGEDEEEKGASEESKKGLTWAMSGPPDLRHDGEKMRPTLSLDLVPCPGLLYPALCGQAGVDSAGNKTSMNSIAWFRTCAISTVGPGYRKEYQRLKRPRIRSSHMSQCMVPACWCLEYEFWHQTRYSATVAQRVDHPKVVTSNGTDIGDKKRLVCFDEAQSLMKQSRVAQSPART